MTRCAAMLVTVVLLAFGWSIDAQQDKAAVIPRARITGHVTAADTGAPIAGAAIQLRPLADGAARSAATDDQGRFEIAALAGGQYVLTVSAEGYFGPDATLLRSTGVSRMIDLKDNQQLDQTHISLAPARAIEGRVLNASGEPAPRVTVQLSQLTDAAGRLRLISGGSRGLGRTDGRGRFRIEGLPPGDYFVLALSGPFGLTGGSAFSSPTDGLVGFAPTYFPGTERAADAQAVHLDAGGDAPDVTFTLIPANMSPVSGTVFDASGAPVANARLMLLQTQGGDLRAMLPANAVSAADGSFRYRNVPPGSYVLQAFGLSQFGVVGITVPRSDKAVDVTGVALTIHPLVSARGHISFDDETPPAKAGVVMSFVPTDFVSGPAGGNRIPSVVNDDWTFAIDQLAWTGVVRAAAPGGWRLKSVKLDGRDITDTPHDFQSADVTGLDVVLTSHVASVGGSVLDRLRPALDGMVVVFSEDGGKWAYPSRFISVAKVRPTGEFTVNSLLPGRYLAVAVPALPLAVDANWLATMRSFATPFQVSAGDAAIVTLKLIRP
jgi:5-hydroxyisourate hydrolase-like protein (transthyretin family)